MSSGIYFEAPWVFAALIVFVLCEKQCKAKISSLIFPHLSLMRGSKFKSMNIQKVLKYLAVVLFITALASPVTKDVIEYQKKEGYAVSILFDASGSMRERGFGNDGRNKFKIAKEILSEFVQKRKNDNISLIVFGDFAYIASPMTYDKNILSSIISTLHLGIAGTKTAIYDALFESSRLFKRSDAKTKIVILLTDGENTAGVTNLDVALKYLNKDDIKVYAIGIGQEGQYDAAALKYISEHTKGAFFKAADENALKEVFAKIDAQEKSTIEGEKFSRYVYYYQYPLFASFLLFLGYIYLRSKEGL